MLTMQCGHCARNYLIIYFIALMCCYYVYVNSTKFNTNGLESKAKSPVGDTASWIRSFLEHSGILSTVAQSRGPLPVLVLAYMRGGSSFSANVLRAQNNSFYMFEPLIGQVDAIDGHHAVIPLQFTSVGQKKYTKLNDTRQMTDVLQNIFKCDLSSLPKVVLNHRFLLSPNWIKSSSLDEYSKCFRNFKINQTIDFKNNTCIQKLEMRCRGSSIRVVKSVRFRMDMVPRLLEHVPDLRVVHIVRDPRGILNSRWSTTQGHVKHVKEDSRILCLEMADNYEAMKRLWHRKMDSVLLYKYEDIATSSGGIVKQLYNTLTRGPVPPEVQQWLQHAVSSHDNGPMGTNRKNATLTAYRWRLKLSTEDVRIVNQQCEQVLRYYGYAL